MNKKSVVAILLSLVMCFALCACGGSEPATPEDRESDVWSVVEDSLASSLGIEISDFKMTHTACSYISSCETSDGMTSHYYLYQSAYEDDWGVEHPVTARAYLVEEENHVYITYITLDGESVYFDEETEDRMLDIG